MAFYHSQCNELEIYDVNAFYLLCQNKLIDFSHYTRSNTYVTVSFAMMLKGL